jgi:hypothetical protein
VLNTGDAAKLFPECHYSLETRSTAVGSFRVIHCLRACGRDSPLGPDDLALSAEVRHESPLENLLADVGNRDGVSDSA